MGKGIVCIESQPADGFCEEQVDYFKREQRNGK